MQTLVTETESNVSTRVSTQVHPTSGVNSNPTQVHQFETLTDKEISDKIATIEKCIASCETQFRALQSYTIKEAMQDGTDKLHNVRRAAVTPSSLRTLAKVCIHQSTVSSHPRQQYVNSLVRNLNAPLPSPGHIAKHVQAILDLHGLWDSCPDFHRSLSESFNTETFDKRWKDKAVFPSIEGAALDVHNPQSLQLQKDSHSIRLFKAESRIRPQNLVTGLDWKDESAAVQRTQLAMAKQNMTPVRFVAQKIDLDGTATTLDCLFLPTPQQKCPLAISVTGLPENHAQVGTYKPVDITTSELNLHPTYGLNSITHVHWATPILHKHAVDLGMVHLTSQVAKRILQTRDSLSTEVENLVRRQFGKHLASEESLHAYWNQLRKNLTKEENEVLRQCVKDYQDGDKRLDVNVVSGCHNSYMVDSDMSVYLLNTDVNIKGAARLPLNFRPKFSADRNINIDNVWSIQNSSLWFH